VKARLEGWLDAATNARFLFIRNARPQPGLVRLYIARTRELEPALYRFDVPGYDALLALDLEAVARGDLAFDPYRTGELLLAVCTNGRRDIACSKYGLPVAEALAASAGSAVWQCSHIGGHRFAATLVALPWGVCYGYLDADDVRAVAQAARNVQVLPEHSRGRSCYDSPVQAADYFLRGLIGARALPGVRLVASESRAADEWTVRLEALAERRVYEVRVRRALSDWLTYESSADAAPKRMPQWHFVSCEAV
jgi:hypothetical protein